MQDNDSLFQYGTYNNNNNNINNDNMHISMPPGITTSEAVSHLPIFIVQIHVTSQKSA